jgi:regulator of sigma E protease
LPALAAASGFLGTIGSFVATWGPGILLLSVLVLFHEFGHFVVAKRLGVPVSRFSIGFGPRLFGVRYRGTDYCVSLLPLGGYVSMAGETTGPDGQSVSVDHFSGEAWHRRAAIAVAGPFANLLVGYLTMVVVGVVGVNYDDYRPLVGPVTPGGEAEHMGLRTGQEIVALDGRPVKSWREILESLSDAEQAVALEVRDAGGARTLTVPAGRADSVLFTLQPYIESVVGRVAVGYPAYSAGLRDGDRIVQVDGEPVALWEDLTRIIHNAAGRPLTLAVERGGRRFETRVTPVAQDVAGRTVGVIGITPPRDFVYTVRSSPLEAVTSAFPLTVQLVRQTGQGLWALLSRPHQAKDQVGGPLLILRMSSQQAERGPSDFLFLVGVISIAIMAFNLLPLPALDGGHLLIALLEGARRKPLAQGFLTAYQRLGLAFIAFLLVFILANDFWREAQRKMAVSRGDAEVSAPDAPR